MLADLIFKALERFFPPTQDALPPVVDDDHDVVLPQYPLTEESRKMIQAARAKEQREEARPPQPLAGSLAARYSAARRKAR